MVSGQFTSFLLPQAVESNYPTSIDCALWCLAICLGKSENAELKKLLKESFSALVKTSDDLLRFASYFREHQDNKLNFGSLMRHVLTSWYDSKSPSELLELVFATPSIKFAAHLDIIRQIHPEFENEDKKVIVKAIHKDYAGIKEAAETSSTLKKILKYRDLKRCKEVHEVLSILKRKDFAYKFNHLHTVAINSPEVWDFIVPNMTLLEVLDKLVFFCDKNMLNPKVPVSRKICNALQVTNKVVKSSQLNPLQVFSIMKTLEEKLTVTSEDGEKKVSNPAVIKKLESIFQHSLNDQPKTGCRFYVTLNFRKNSKRRKCLKLCTTVTFQQKFLPQSPKLEVSAALKRKLFSRWLC